MDRNIRKGTVAGVHEAKCPTCGSHLVGGDDCYMIDCEQYELFLGIYCTESCARQAYNAWRAAEEVQT